MSPAYSVFSLFLPTEIHFLHPFTSHLVSSSHLLLIFLLKPTHSSQFTSLIINHPNLFYSHSQFQCQTWKCATNLPPMTLIKSFVTDDGQDHSSSWTLSHLFLKSVVYFSIRKHWKHASSKRSNPTHFLNVFLFFKTISKTRWSRNMVR